MMHVCYAFSILSATTIPQHTHFMRCRRRPRSIYTWSMSIPSREAVQTVVYGEGLMDLHELPGGQWDAYPGGAPNNLACALGKLGYPTAYVGSIGVDEYGRQLIAELKRSGVNIDTVQMCRDNPTRGVYVKYTQGGQPEFAGYSSKGSACADAQEMDSIGISEFPNAVVLAIGTLPLASPGSRKTQELMVAKARERGMCVVVDLNWRNVFWNDSPAGLRDARRTIMEFVRNNASYIKASVEDLKFLIEDFTGAEQAAEILDAFGADIEGILITDGDKGCRYHFRNSQHSTDMDVTPSTSISVSVSGNVDAFKVEDGAIDCVGAGDAFLAGFIAETFNSGGLQSLSDADKARDVVEFASAVAQFVVRGKGAVGPQPSRAAVENFLDDFKNKDDRSTSPSTAPTEKKDVSAR